MMNQMPNLPDERLSENSSARANAHSSVSTLIASATAVATALSRALTLTATVALTLAFAITLALSLTGCASMGQQDHSKNGTTTVQSQSDNADEIFLNLDTNHDGYVSKEEMRRALDLFSEDERMESTQMVYGLKSKKESAVDKLKHLSAAQKKKLIARAFEKNNSKSATDDQERLTQDEFRKIVIGPQTSNDSRGEDDAPELEPNLWQKLL